MESYLRPALAVLILLTASSCKHDETDFSAPPPRKTKFTDGMGDSELLKVATDKINSGNYDEAAQALRALSDQETKESSALRVRYYNAVAAECTSASDWACVLQNTTNGLRETATAAVHSCGKEAPCRDTIENILQNAIPEEVAKCWTDSEACPLPVGVVETTRPVWNLHEAKQRAVDTFLESGGGAFKIPLPEEAICVAMNYATTKTPIAIHDIDAQIDGWTMNYRRADGARYNVGCRVAGNTVKFRLLARWNTQSTVTYSTEFRGGEAHIIITQTWAADGSKNVDRIGFDELSKFGASTDAAIADLRKTALESS